MSLKQKTVTGLTWSFIDSFANQGVQFAIGIILARLLSPKEFGLIGMIIIFTAISQAFINSGFSQALIRKSNCEQKDYSTVFYFNFAVGIILYLILFFLAGPISRFYKEAELLLLIRVLGIILIINGLGLIQRTILTKNIDFKLQTKVSFISTVISGIIAIGMALYGWGVWSLVWKTIFQNLIAVILLWFWNSWRPVLLFNMVSFREMFSFGSKLLISGLIDTLYNNLYYLIIGKCFSATDLGYFARADEFRNMPSTNLTSIIGRVSYPVLSTIQGDDKKLKTGYKKLIMSSMFISFVLMMGMAATAKAMIITLIGEKWLPVVPYLQLLCFVGMLYPLHALNLNMLNVKGRSDLFLKLEVVKKLMAVPIIIVGAWMGIRPMIVGMIILSFIGYFLNSYWSGQLIGYPMKEQIRDILPSFLIAVVMGGVVFLFGYLLSPLNPLLTLFAQISVGVLIALSMAKLTRSKAYMDMREIICEKFASGTA